MSVTDDPNDPRLTRGADPADGPPVAQAPVYLVMTEAERNSGFVRPLRDSYVHEICGSTTTMSREIAETYAAQPTHYGSTYCCACRKHRPVGADGEFYWVERDNSHLDPA